MAIVGKNNKTTSGFFEGCHFIVELGVLSQSRKKDIFNSIEVNGGIVDFVISKKTTHVITNEASLLSYKLKSARTHGCFMVSEEYLTTCVDAGRRVDEWRYSFIGETSARELGNYKDSSAYVGAHLAQAFAGVSAVMNVVYPSVVDQNISEGALNIAALCAGLGAHVPSGTFPLKSVVNSLYFVILNKDHQPTKSEFVQPTVVQPPLPKKSIPTPLSREISSRPTSLSTPYSRSTPSALSSSSSTSSSSSSSSSTSSIRSPIKPSAQSPVKYPAQALVKSSTQSLVRPSTQSSSTQSPLVPTATSSSTSIRPFSFSSSFSSRTSPSSSATPAPSSTTPTTAAPLATKAVSYSYAQYDAERRKKREEEKAQREGESGSVLREREARRKEEEEARKKILEDKRLEMLERRKQEDDERKQKNREISEARDKRIAEERKKREQALERLKQKAPHDLLTTSFFQQLDDEESSKRMQEEWVQHMKEMEAAQRKEQEKEKAARQRADQLFAEKEKKIQEREEQAKLAVAERAALKIRRREEYETNKVLEASKKQQEFEENQAKLLAEFVKRQQRRARKQLSKEKPEIKKDYDEHKIFIGGIKLDDIIAAKFKPELAQRVRDERINAVLRMFDQFGPVHQRKVFAEKGICFITFQNKESVAIAVETMKDAETRKKLVEEAKEAQKGYDMNPLCVPHPQFYVRIPQPKNKKNKKSVEESTSSPSSSSSSPAIHEGEWITQSQQPSATTPASPPPPGTLRTIPTGADDVAPPHDESSPPSGLGRPPRVFKIRKEKPMPRAPPEIDLNDVNTFPTSSNVFCNLDDEEIDFS